MNWRYNQEPCGFKVELFSTVQYIMIVCSVKKNFNSGGKNFLPPYFLFDFSKILTTQNLAQKKGDKVI